MLSTSFCLDLHADVVVDGEDDEIGDDVKNAHSHENLRVLEGYPLRHLHHSQDNHQVGAANSQSRAHIAVEAGGSYI